MNKLVFVLIVALLLIGCTAKEATSPPPIFETVIVEVTPTSPPMSPERCQPDTAEHLSLIMEQIKNTPLKLEKQTDTNDGLLYLFKTPDSKGYRCILASEYSYIKYWFINDQGFSDYDDVRHIDQIDATSHPKYFQKWSDWGKWIIEDSHYVFETDRTVTERDFAISTVFEENIGRFDEYLKNFFLRPDWMNDIEYSSIDSPARECDYISNWSGVIPLPEIVADCASPFPQGYANDNATWMVSETQQPMMSVILAPLPNGPYPKLEPGVVLYDDFVVTEICIEELFPDYIYNKGYTVSYFNIERQETSEATFNMPNQSHVQWVDSLDPDKKSAIYQMVCP